MSFCTDQILALASGIYQDINSPSSLSVPFISGWITSSGSALGDINNKLGTSFWLSGDQPCIAGCFGADEANILGLIYKTSYYEKQGIAILQGGGTFWTSISEGDTKISRTSVRDISNAYKDWNQSNNTLLRIAISDWKRNHTPVLSIDSEGLYGYPAV